MEISKEESVTKKRRIETQNAGKIIQEPMCLEIPCQEVLMQLQEQLQVNQNLQAQIAMKDKRIQELEQKNLESPLKEPMSSKHLMELPNECLLNILGYLSNFDVLRNVAGVCKRFYELSQDQHLIRKIKVGSETWAKIQEEKYCENLLKVLKRSLNLTYLSFDFGWNDEVPGEMFLKALSSMNHQFLKEVNIRAKEFLHQEILKYLEKCSNLRVLKLEFEPKKGNDVTQILIHKYLNWITSFKLKNLEEYHFGYELYLDGSTFFQGSDTS